MKKTLTRILIMFTAIFVFPNLTLADEPASHQVFLPFVIGRVAAPVSDAPAAPVTPVDGGQTLWPVSAASVSSQWADYPSALAGTQYVSGTERLCRSGTPTGNLVYSLTEQNFFGVSYIINRQYVEFDTTGIPADFEVAQLSLTGFTPYAGPPAHHIAVHTGTWTELANDGCNFYPTNWNAYKPARLVTLYGGDPNVFAWQPMNFTLPREAINPGGITRLVLRTTTEGTAPTAQLGGAFTALSLTINTAGGDGSN